MREVHSDNAPGHGDGEPTRATDFAVFRELRVVVAMSDEQLAERLVKSLERAGALVVLTHPGGDRLRHAASIDPQLVYVDADGLGSKGMRLGRALQSNPRLRWASVLRFSSHQLSSNDPRDPTLVRLAVESKPRIQIDSLLTERARRDPPFVVQMARIGPNRLLRALEPIDGALRVTVLGPRAVAQIDLENGRLIGASWKEVTPDRVSIEGLDAVATFLTLEHGDVRIERRERTTLSNVNERLSSALALAAARIPTGTEITERPTLEDEIPDLLELELLDHGKRDSETQRTGPPGEPPWLHLGFNFGEEVFGDLVHDTIVSAPPSSLSRTNTEAADEAVTRHVAESEVRSFLEAAEGFDAHADTDAGDTSPDETANATRIAGNPTALLGPRERTGPRPLFQDAGFDHDADDDALTLVREPSERHGLQGHDAEESPHFELDRPVSTPPRRSLRRLRGLSDAPPPAADEEAERETFIRELPLVFRMPRIDATRPTGARQIDGLPATPRELRLPDRETPKSAFDRLEPTEQIRFRTAGQSVRPPAHPIGRGGEPRWIPFLPLASFVVGLGAVAGTLLLVRHVPDTASTGAKLTVSAAPVSSTDPMPEAQPVVGSSIDTETPGIAAWEPVDNAAAPVVLPPTHVRRPTDAHAQGPATAPRTVDVLTEPDPGVLLTEAERLLLSGRTDLAESTVAVILKMDPKNARGAELMVRICLRDERAGEAVSWAKTLVEAAPRDPRARFLLGDALGASGDIVQARAEWRRAEELKTETAAETTETR